MSLEIETAKLLPIQSLQKENFTVRWKSEKVSLEIRKCHKMPRSYDESKTRPQTPFETYFPHPSATGKYSQIFLRFS